MNIRKFICTIKSRGFKEYTCLGLPNSILELKLGVNLTRRYFTTASAKNIVNNKNEIKPCHTPVINYETLKCTKTKDAFEGYNFMFGKHDDYEILNKLGSGKYSQVYDGIDIVNDRFVVIKIIKPVKKKRIRREIAILNLLQHENIVKLLDVIIDPSSNTPSLVFERINHTDFRTLFPKLNSHDIKFYLHCILKGLEHAHSKNIMHRDIKPHNIIIDHKLKKLKIIDWGLSEVYSENVEYSVRVSTRYYKAPELLLDYQCYDYSGDLWSLGCLFAGLIFKKEPFFHGNDNFDQLIKIVKVLGSEDIHEYISKFHLKVNSNYDGLLEK